jgi:hypothetical protein
MALRDGLRTNLDRSGIGYNTVNELIAQFTAFDTADSAVIGATGPTGPTGATGPVAVPAGVIWTSGTGSPETVVTATVGSLYSRTNGGAGTSLYVKETGAGNTGWIGK